ncbi:MAG: response regulator transcription factor [Anaerolineae bacterium]|nr:response regulator transcription factor [Anaerolineae bacterium]
MEAHHLRVLIVEPDAILRNALLAFLEATEQVMPVGSAATAAEALDLCQKLHPDVILLESHLPDMDGVEAIRRLRNAYPAAPIVVLASTLQEGVMREALMAGATGWLEKWMSADQVIEGLRIAARKKSPDALRQPNKPGDFNDAAG